MHNLMKGVTNCDYANYSQINNMDLIIPIIINDEGHYYRTDFEFQQQLELKSYL